jgi:hypothetical protein
MLIGLPSQTNPSAEAHQHLPRSTQKTSIVEQPIQRSGFIVHERSCTLSFQAVNRLNTPVHPPERVTGPAELHHSDGRYPGRRPWQQIGFQKTRLRGLAKNRFKINVMAALTAKSVPDAASVTRIRLRMGMVCLNTSIDAFQWASCAHLQPRVSAAASKPRSRIQSASSTCSARRVLTSFCSLRLCSISGRSATPFQSKPI